VPAGQGAVPKQSQVPCAEQPGARDELHSPGYVQVVVQPLQTQVNVAESQLLPVGQSCCCAHSTHWPPSQMRDEHWLLVLHGPPLACQGEHEPELQELPFVQSISALHVDLQAVLLAQTRRPQPSLVAALHEAAPSPPSQVFL
jgi:hypothetical protein